MVIVGQRLTLDEFLELPEQKPALEYLDGVVTEKVSPKLSHSVLQLDLAMRVMLLAMPSKLARAFPELRVTWTGARASFVPDVSVYRWERVRIDANGEVVDDVFDPPDVAIEIASPGQGRRRLLERCRWFVEHGAAAAVLVDPRDRSVTVVRPGSTTGPLYGDDVVDLDDVVPGLRFSVAELFASLRMD